MVRRNRLRDFKPQSGTDAPGLVHCPKNNFEGCKRLDTDLRGLFGAYEQATGNELEIPPHLSKAMFLWRRLCVRLSMRDLRQTNDEIKAMTEVANWVLACNADIRAQPRPAPLAVINPKS